MSAVAVDTRLGRSLRFYQTTLGKKVVMAVTGAIMFGFVLGHMLGNLQAFLGREQLDHYAVLLRTVPELLWVVRAVLLISVILHIVASLQLKKTQMDARPIGYVKRKPVGSSIASRTMIWSGIVIALFIPYHLMHFTLGVPGIHPSFQELKPYENLVAGFRVIPVALFYVVAMILLSTHLYHGVWSMFQTLGANNASFSPKLRLFAKVFAVVVTLGFISLPIAVMAGLLT
jgi:succinate dehydrogenase / fumarate reductase cytochrome b subunit